MAQKDTLPAVLDGHWTTPEGHEKAVEYAGRSRADLRMADCSDLGLANVLYLSTGDIAIQAAAKERMRWLSVQLALANARAAELQQTFDLQWKADQRAIKRWQVAHPGNDLVWPDRCNMVVWLLDQSDEAQKALAVVRQSLLDQAEARADPDMPHLTSEVLEKLRGDAEAAYALAETQEERVAAHGLSLLCDWQDRASTSRQEADDVG